MTFSTLSSYWQKLEATSSRNEMTAILADLFKKSSHLEIDKVCYLSLGVLAPKYEGIEFNLAEKLMIRVLAKAFGVKEEKVRQEYKRSGDLGETITKIKNKKLKIKNTNKKLKISVDEVYKKLREIAEESGEGSVKRKINKMAELLRTLDPVSAKFVARIPVGKLRLGFSDMTILDALSWMIAGDKSKRVEIELTYNVRADIGQIARLLKNKGLKGLKGIKISLGVPIMPALCQRLPSAEEMVEKLAEMAVEPKYDGTRLQVHFSKKRKFVRTFTRNLENTTHMFPDLVQAIFKEVKATEAILDGEAIGFDSKTGKFLPFQETIKRKRKYEISAKTKEIPLKFFCFDILYKDGKDLLKMPFSKRRQILEKITSSINKTIILSPQIVTENPDKLRSYHDEEIKKGLEGVVVKKWQAPYDPGRRGYTWVKFKQEEGKKGGGLADTLDCIVMGYYKGKGKRATFGIGGFLVGIVLPLGKKLKIKNEKLRIAIKNLKLKEDYAFLTVSKIGTGLTDAQWRELHQRCEKLKTDKKPEEYVVDKNLLPDVWCQPKIVVEIEADNITKSPIHTAGLALRFPRLKQFRDDKDPQQATSLSELKKLAKMKA